MLSEGSGVGIHFCFFCCIPSGPTIELDWALLGLTSDMLGIIESTWALDAGFAAVADADAAGAFAATVVAG